MRSRLFALALAWVAFVPPAVFAQVPTVPADQAKTQSVVRTTRDKVLVWRRGPSAVIATLPEGVTLEAIARDGQWYQVRVPEKFAGPGGAIGFVYKGHVQLVEGPEPPMRVLAPAVSQTVRDARRKAPPPAFSARGYGIVSID
jgi:hypothetical protein